MNHFTPLSALLGGLLIGLSAALLLLFSGRIAGVSGILGGIVLPRPGEVAWRAFFLAGLAAGGLALDVAYPEAFASSSPARLPIVVGAGLLVGFGTRLANGCTSGHGVCGLSRLSARSLVATLTFMATGGLTVAVARHLLGGAR